MSNKNVINWDSVPVLFDIVLACRLFGVSRETIYKWTKRDMPYIKIGSTVRFDKNDIKKWLKECAN